MKQNRRNSRSMMLGSRSFWRVFRPTRVDQNLAGELRALVACGESTEIVVERRCADSEIAPVTNDAKMRNCARYATGRVWHSTLSQEESAVNHVGPGLNACNNRHDDEMRC